MAQNSYRQNTQIRLLASFSSLAATTLSAALTSPYATTALVTSAAGFPASGNYDFWVDAEKITVTAGQGSTTWTLIRGVAGTIPAAHDNGAAVVAAVGTPADPGAVTARIKDPNGAVTTPTVTRDNTGNYHLDYTTPAVSGIYGYSFLGTTPVIAQVEGTFIVLPSVTS